MDYETADGSQFSLQEVFSERDGEPAFECTSVTAYVDGKAYAGKTYHRMNEVDDVDIVNYLQRVPTENIHPRFPPKFTKAPPFDIAQHYLKAPSFTFEDGEPARTFIADCLLSEARILEKLKQHPHPNIVEYYGCVVENDRITQLCLKRYFCSLADYAETSLTDRQREKLFSDVTSAIKHLHSLGLAHNDLCPDNICIDADGTPAIVDFDSCLPFGEKLMKGFVGEGRQPVSDRENDYSALDDLRDFLETLPSVEDDVTAGSVDGATEATLLPQNMSPNY